MRGGAVQGIGWGLLEAMIYDEHGMLLNGTFVDSPIPRAADVPSMEIVMVEVPSDTGPFGAKGVGEPPVIPGAAAIANAIADAVGVQITNLPITPQKDRDRPERESKVIGRLIGPLPFGERTRVRGPVS